MHNAMQGEQEEGNSILADELMLDLDSSPSSSMNVDGDVCDKDDKRKQPLPNTNYKNDINVGNCLGTKGEFAEEFAKLLRNLWEPRNNAGYNDSIAPTNFKYTLGRFANQFMGTEQHDSQELANYTIDMLHEDTNRVRSKPITETIEQLPGETDEKSSSKAWDAKLSRDDSMVHDIFMGQFKSVVQCSEEHCGRESTTFDPFMYLSVELPPGTRREKGVYVDLEGNFKPFELTFDAGTSFGKFKMMVAESLGYGNAKHDDLVCVAVFQGKVYSDFEDSKETELSSTDKLYIYQLDPILEIDDANESIEKCADKADTEAHAKTSSTNDRKRDPVLVEVNFTHHLKDVTRDCVASPLLIRMNQSQSIYSLRVKIGNRLKRFRATSDGLSCSGIDRMPLRLSKIGHSHNSSHNGYSYNNYSTGLSGSFDDSQLVTLGSIEPYFSNVNGGGGGFGAQYLPAAVDPRNAAEQEPIGAHVQQTRGRGGRVIVLFPDERNETQMTELSACFDLNGFKEQLVAFPDDRFNERRAADEVSDESEKSRLRINHSNYKLTWAQLLFVCHDCVFFD